MSAVLHRLESSIFCTMGRTERWIKLRLHVRHPRIIDLADELGCSAAEALACAVDWFRQLDADAASGRTYSPAAVDAAAGQHSGDVPFHLAARRIGWLVEDGNRLAPSDPTAWFSAAARERLRRRGDSVSQRDTNPPQRGTDRRQSRAESDERREEMTDRPAAGSCSGSSADPTGQGNGVDPGAAMGDDAVLQRRRRGLPGLTGIEQVQLLETIRRSGIATNNAGRAANWLRNVIPDGYAFLRRVQHQAVDQGLPQGTPSHARYVYGCIRDEARSINGHNAPIDQPAVQHAAKHSEDKHAQSDD